MLKTTFGVAAVWHYAHFVLATAPEEAQRPWAAASEDALLADPRVCAFADGYERERLRLLDLEPAPSDLPSLELWLDLVHRLDVEAAFERRAACATEASADLDTTRRLSHLVLMLRNAARHAAEEESR